MKQATNIKEILNLKKMLPYGSYKKISLVTGYTDVYVGNVLCGRQEINDKNITIIEEAQKIASASQKSFNKRMDKLNSFLSK